MALSGGGRLDRATDRCTARNRLAATHAHGRAPSFSRSHQCHCPQTVVSPPTHPPGVELLGNALGPDFPAVRRSGLNPLGTLWDLISQPSGGRG